MNPINKIAGIPAQIMGVFLPNPAKRYNLQKTAADLALKEMRRSRLEAQVVSRMKRLRDTHEFADHLSILRDIQVLRVDYGVQTKAYLLKLIEKSESRRLELARIGVELNELPLLDDHGLDNPDREGTPEVVAFTDTREGKRVDSLGRWLHYASDLGA